MDKKAILDEIVRRNELRREAQLPALDIETEFEHACQVAAQAEYGVLFDRHRDELRRIEAQVIEEWRQKYGPSFGYSAGAKWVVGYNARPRYRAFLKAKYGLDEPPIPSRSVVVYGEAKKKEGEGAS